jgi:putative hydrolase of the HAD superfamily
MGTSAGIKALFLDIGGVLLTNGWDRHMRTKAAEKFGLDYQEMDERHHLTFDTYESGKLSLEEYLNRVVFYQPRSFSQEEFKEFMFSGSQPFPDMIDFVCALKARYGLKLAAVSNEGRELTVHRIQKYQLSRFLDFYISSCFVHFRKPDEDIYRMALDIAQVQPERVIYIDDRNLFVEVAEGLGIRGIHHTSYGATRATLAGLGLAADS